MAFAIWFVQRCIIVELQITTPRSLRCLIPVPISFDTLTFQHTRP